MAFVVFDRVSGTGRQPALAREDHADEVSEQLDSDVIPICFAKGPDQRRGRYKRDSCEVGAGVQADMSPWVAFVGAGLRVSRWF